MVRKNVVEALCTIQVFIQKYCGTNHEIQCLCFIDFEKTHIARQSKMLDILEIIIKKSVNQETNGRGS